MVSHIEFKSNSTVRLTTTKQYDKLNRLTSISSVGTGSTPSVNSYAYSYNDANQRTRVNLADGSFWIYDYDALGQVISGKRYWSDWTPVAGQQFEYGFDEWASQSPARWFPSKGRSARAECSGNRTGTKTGGDAVGASLRLANYTNNALNQFTGRTVPSYLDIVGAATATATNVNVNNTLAYRKGEYYRVELNPNNTNAAVWQNVTNRAVQSGTTNSSTGNLYLPKTPEIFGYDADGNLTNDGRWAYVWDGENRLVRQFAPTTAPSGSVKALTYGYDWQGRRISKTVSNWSGSAWSRVLEEKYLYDGWNLLSSLNATNSSVVQAFLWGSDLSGSMQGAGGVGGLLFISQRSTGQPSACFTAYDGNGNVTALVNAAGGNAMANYEYGPFGEVIRSSGAATKGNPFRFSTKFQDDESDLLYYGNRFYSQSLGRWLTKDPILEKGGKNIYNFCASDPVNAVDVNGLYVELWYGNHPVTKGSHHSKLWVITDEIAMKDSKRYEFLPALSKTEPGNRNVQGPCNLWFLAIGAGPDMYLDELIAEFNRPKDRGEKLNNASLVTTFSSSGDALSFLKTVSIRNETLNANFQNTTLEYDLEPSSSYTAFHGWDEFNSNSYVSGLLSVFGYTIPPPGVSVPGYEKPVPGFVFTTQFSSTADLKNVWKQHYPGF